MAPGNSHDSFERGIHSKVHERRISQIVHQFSELSLLSKLQSHIAYFTYKLTTYLPSQLQSQSENMSGIEGVCYPPLPPPRLVLLQIFAHILTSNRLLSIRFAIPPPRPTICQVIPVRLIYIIAGATNSPSV